MTTTITKHERDEFGNFIAHVRVDGVARKDIVPGYPGYETATVSIREDGSASTTLHTIGRHGYRCDSGKVRAAAIRAARREWARVAA